MEMQDSVKLDIARVVAGFMRLSGVDQETVIKIINEYLKQDYNQKKVLMENYKKRAGLDLGPVRSGGCPCCGRG